MSNIMNNPFDFDYVMFRYLYAVKENIEEETFFEVSNHKLKKYLQFLNELDKKLSINQRMLFRDEMFSFNRFELTSLVKNKDKLKNESLSINGTLKDSIPPFYYPESNITFSNVEIENVINGHKEKIALESVLKLPLILQCVQPSYDESINKNIVELYVSVDIYNPKFDELIKIDALSNICQIKFSYEDVAINLGLRNMTSNIYENK